MAKGGLGKYDLYVEIVFFGKITKILTIYKFANLKFMKFRASDSKFVSFIKCVFNMAEKLVFFEKCFFWLRFF